jgi:hypothetical protein
MSQYNPFDPLNPLEGLQNIPGVDFKGADNFVTTGGLLKGVQGLATGLSKGYNPALTLGLAGTNFIGGLREASTNLANIANTRQDIIKKGADITETGLDISKKKFDFGNDQTARNALMMYINQLPVDQQVLALTNPEEFSKNLIARTAPTGSIKEYEYAVAQGYKGSYPEYIKNIEKFRATTFNMGTEGAYAKAAGEKGFELDHEMVQQTYNMTNAAKEGNVAAKILAEGKAYTGAFAPQRNFLAKVQDFLTGDNKLSESVTVTEVLTAMTGKQVFPMIGELGIGARGLDTPAERKFLQGVMTGDISMDANTLLKLNMMARRRQQAFADRFNAKLTKGDFKNYQEARGKLEEFNLPTLVPVAQFNRDGRMYQVYNDGYARFLDDKGNMTDDMVRDENDNIIDFVGYDQPLVGRPIGINQ